MFGIKENHIDEERVIFLQLWIEVVRDEGDWKSGRSLILVCSFHYLCLAFGLGGDRALVYIYQSQQTLNG
jgi:hypothetical protein